MITRDLLWKGIIEDLCDDFLLFFFPVLAKEVDFDRPFEFLDSTLEKIYPANDLANRYADKLVKVYLKSGQEVWVLIHIEVQGYSDNLFGKRMFTMFYRLFDRFEVEINQIAIFTDDSKAYHPKGFSLKNHGTWLDYGFKTWKLLDNPPGSYPDKANVFAIAMETAWYGLKKNKKGDAESLDMKLNLTKNLFRQNIQKSKIANLLGFIQFYTHFENPDFSLKFEDEVYQKSQNMGIEALIKEALIAQGKEEGIELGMEKGMEKSYKKSIDNMLKKGFKPDQIADILDLDLGWVKKIQKSLKAEQKKPKK